MQNNRNMKAWILECLYGIVTIIGGIILASFCGWVAIKAADFYTRIFIIPVLFCSVSIIIQGCIQFLKGLNMRKGMNDDTVLNSSVFDKNYILNILDKTCSKLSIVGFLLFWFVLLIVFDYTSITQGEPLIFIVSLPFWIVGILVAIMNFKR